MDAKQDTIATPDGDVEYDTYIKQMRQEEYPMLKDTVYLDHAGTSLPNKSTLDQFHAEMLANLYCNPHSTSSGSQQTSQDIADIRLQLLRFLNASPENFDLVFTTNATAGIKLVTEALRDRAGGFNYGYHLGSHTSLVGTRMLAKQSLCVRDTTELLTWHHSIQTSEPEAFTLFAYPAQSNMDGSRLPLSWCKIIRDQGLHTLLDAAAYTPTAELNLDAIQPDFTVLSLSKIFGFPDLGALVIRKESGQLLRGRKYFGGGTVDMVLCRKEQWHVSRAGALHEQLEDGSLPIHSILALRPAMAAHTKLFGSLARIASHTHFLARRLHNELQGLRHANDSQVVMLYTSGSSAFECLDMQGPTLALNLKDRSGQWISNTEIEKLASIKNIQLRTGSMCNPGGVAEALSLEAWEIRQNHLEGYRCSGENDIFNGKPSGVIRVSLGAMSTLSDVLFFVDFVKEYFVDHTTLAAQLPTHISSPPSLHVESLIVYPIKSCAGWVVPYDVVWDIRQEGLAWDREWCIVHLGTGAAVSQKRYPRMALIRPELDFVSGRLRIKLGHVHDDINVPLSLDPSALEGDDWESCRAKVCDDTIEARRYVSTSITEKLSAFLGVACTLARFPTSQSTGQSARHRKHHLQRAQPVEEKSILLSNESPILTITRSSLNALNETLKAKGQRAAHYSVFRANIILAEPPHYRPGAEQPWIEDQWQTMSFRSPNGLRTMELESLGGCRRCQMVCIDQLTAEKRPEVFLTLAKQRRIGGRVLFGVHTALHRTSHGRIQVGDFVNAT